MSYRTEQEAFWAGGFGNEYIGRNNDTEIVAANLALFARILQATQSIASVIEFGSNIGLNLQAIRHLLPKANLAAIELNTQAVAALQKQPNVSVFHQSILDFEPEISRDFVFIKGVLIHINPNELATVYEKLYRSSNRYICIVEYYSPTPVELDYRGHNGKLFKRDFAGEMLDAYSNLKLLDYGFVYHRDTHFEQDDLNWFLMEKR
ncbi:pseudaminic acid biosynthesis-associated methylase [uncultured Paraglaciecola sp.]|uniref:pseudaminic acid biosynthesis-associated methylase n=1 Tax=uncultured Paraglaciecola sp. TaxID=1765024 RepID=UPI0025F0ED39|nr:pseudaminic acid biosynthesis-associated methylase [uncultured Paraglaciecola sp.]